jgi:hypothetical protein
MRCSRRLRCLSVTRRNRAENSAPISRSRIGRPNRGSGSVGRMQMRFGGLNNLVDEFPHRRRSFICPEYCRDSGRNRVAGQRPKHDVWHLNDGCQDARNDRNPDAQRDLGEDSQQAAWR